MSIYPERIVRKRLPAYGKQFVGRPYATLRLGHEGMQMTAREVARGIRCVIALPPGNCPSDIDWSLLSGLDVQIVEHEDQGQEFRLTLMRSLAMAGVNVGYLIPASRRKEDCIMIGIQLSSCAGRAAA